jgi:single-strand DNA-binding protein
MNTVSLIGRLTRDPEQKFTTSGDAVTTFSIAVDRAGDRQDDGTIGAGFFDCVTFGKTAELVAQWFHKGKQIGVTGSLQHHRWVNNDGDKRSVVQLRIFDITFVGSKDDNQRDYSDGDDQFVPVAPGGQASMQADFSASDADDGIPF